MAFVVLWSTGFIGAKYGTNHAEPFTFLALRFGITLAVLLPVILIFMKPDLRGRQFLHSMVSGFLVHGIYLGAVFFAIDRGMPAGISALVVALQPFFTAFTARIVLDERISWLQAICFCVALFGVFLVLFPDLDLERCGSRHNNGYADCLANRGDRHQSGGGVSKTFCHQS